MIISTALPSQTIPASEKIFHRLASDLKLNKFKKIGNFFISTKEKNISKISAYILAIVNRIAHFIFTGIWINKTQVGKLINEYRFSIIFSDIEESKIRKAFETLSGPGTYESLFRDAMKETWMDKLSNGLSFIANFIQHPLTVGAILPSSKHLAARISKHIKTAQTSKIGCNFLEIGPGTGEFTYDIVKKLRPQDTLDLVEYDKRFCKILRQRFGHLKNVHIRHISITDWKPDGYKYDGVVSGLPLNAFSSEMVNKIYEKFLEVTKEGAHLSYFEYPFLANIKKAFLSKKEKSDLNGVLNIKDEFYKKFKGTSEIEWLNIPPAIAKHCKISKE